MKGTTCIQKRDYKTRKRRQLEKGANLKKLCSYFNVGPIFSLILAYPGT